MLFEIVRSSVAVAITICSVTKFKLNRFPIWERIGHFQRNSTVLDTSRKIPGMMEFGMLQQKSTSLKKN